MTSRIRGRTTPTREQLYEHERYRSHHSHRLAHLPSCHPQVRLSSRQTIQTWTFLLDQARGKVLEARTEIIAGIRTLPHPSMIISPPRWPDLRLELRQPDMFATVVQYHTKRINPDDR
jgi:hypothetical protein